MYKVRDNNGLLELPNDPYFEPNPEGFGYHCFHKMIQFRDNIAQVDSETNETETYGDILLKSIRVALQLKSYRIGSDDTVSLCTNTHKQTCLPYWGAAFSGIKIANLDPSLSLSDMKHLTSLVSPKIIFCVPESVKTLETVIKELNLDTKLVVFGDTDKHIPFSSFLEPQLGEKDFKPKKADSLFDTVFILFSSGTTGLPKGVCITHYGILENVNFLKSYYNWKCSLFYTSPYWISYSLLIISTLMQGGRRIICPKYEEKNVLPIIEKYKVTFLFVPPSLTYGITAIMENSEEIYDTKNLETFLLGGSITAPEQIKKIRKLFPHSLVTQVYGMTEIAGLFSCFDPIRDTKLLNSKIESCGVLLPGTQAKVVDFETNNLLRSNQRGELLIKSKRLMNGYYNNVEKTAEAYDEQGFLRTGDVVYYDDEYCFYVVDRIKEMFKYKSWHIVPAELECILLKHPAVKEALVIGRPHEQDGDHPMAVIVLNNDVSITEDKILQYFNEKVSDRKQLRGGVKFIKTLPRTTTGKYSRKVLREMVINNTI